MVAALAPIYGITLIDVLGYTIMIPLLPYYAQRFGASGTVVGALLATMAVASAIAAPFWGALSDRVGRKPIVLISQFVSLAAYLLLAWAPSLAMLFVARGIAGIGGGNLGVTQSYIADVTDEQSRDKAFAGFGIMFGAGIVLGPVLGGALVHIGFWLPFVVSAGIEVVNIGLTLRFLPNTGGKRGTIDVRRAAREVWTNANVRGLILRHFLFIFAVTFFFSIFALYLKRALGFGPEHASFMIASAGVVGGITLWLAVGPLAKRYGDAVVAEAGFGVSVVAYALLGFAHTLWTFAGVLVIWAIGASCIEPTVSALLSTNAPADRRGEMLGFNDLMNNVALMLAPTLGGFIVDANISLIGLVPGLAVLTGFVLGWPAVARGKTGSAVGASGRASRRDPRALNARPPYDGELALRLEHDAVGFGDVVQARLADGGLQLLDADAVAAHHVELVVAVGEERLGRRRRERVEAVRARADQRDDRLQNHEHADTDHGLRERYRRRDDRAAEDRADRDGHDEVERVHARERPVPRDAHDDHQRDEPGRRDDRAMVDGRPRVEPHAALVPRERLR
jgi:DHA1 family tetracycline resistance protein-like MFS transporter